MYSGPDDRLGDELPNQDNDRGTQKTGWPSRLYVKATNSVANQRFYWLLLLLFLPALWAGFIGDDHFHAARLLNPEFIPAADDASLFDLFSISDGELSHNRELVNKGLMPWWTHDEFRFQLWRPLAEISHWVDYRLWPDSPFLMHVHTGVWLLAMFWLVLRFWRRFCADPKLANLAFVLFALSANISQLVYWLACRNTVMGLALGLAALLVHIHSRESGFLRHRLAAILLFALALGSSEFGLAASAWLFAWTMILDQGSLLRKVLRLAPYGLLMKCWIYIYVGFSHGASFSDFYIDPIHSSGEYLQALLERFPKLLFLTMTALPPQILGSLEVGGSGWLLSMGFILLVAWLARRALAQPQWQFFVLGAFLSILPVAAGPSSGRTTAYIALGVVPLMALVLQSWALLAYQKVDVIYSALEKRLLALVGWPMLILTLIGALLTPAGSALYWYNNYKNTLLPAKNLPITAADTERTIVLLNPNSVIFALNYPLYRINHQLPLSRELYPLASGQRAIELKRESDNAFVMTPEGGYLIEPQAHFVRPYSEHYTPGSQLTLAGMTVEPLSFTEDGRPLSVRFTFLASLDSEALRLLQCQQLNYVDLEPPAIGESVTLPPCES